KRVGRCNGPVRTNEVPVSVRRVDSELTDTISVRVGDTKARAPLDAEKAQGRTVDVPAMRHRTGDERVVSLGNGEKTTGGLDARASLLHEPDLVTVRVGEIRLVCRARARDPDGGLVGEEDRGAVETEHRSVGGPIRVVEASLKRLRSLEVR